MACKDTRLPKSLRMAEHFVTFTHDSDDVFKSLEQGNSFLVDLAVQDKYLGSTQTVTDAVVDFGAGFVILVVGTDDRFVHSTVWPDDVEIYFFPHFFGKRHEPDCLPL